MSILDDNILLGIGKRMRILRKITVNLKSRMQTVETDSEKNKTDMDDVKKRLDALEIAREP